VRGGLKETIRHSLSATLDFKFARYDTLSLSVQASRIEEEYALPVRFEPSQFTSARWVSGTKTEMDKFINVNKGHIATDSDGDTVFLTRLKWDIDRIERDYPALTLSATKEMMV
jgi:peptide chain release factor 3